MLGLARVAVVPVFVLGLLGASAMAAHAVPISFNTWYEFSWSGSIVSGCSPSTCTGSSGTPTVFAGDPAWTFTAPGAGATLTVVDAFILEDRFEVFDFASSIGLTSLFGGGFCGDDPVVCLGSPNASKATFALAAGGHSITIGVNPPSSWDQGASYFKVTATAVPEPTSLLLLATGLLGAARAHRRRRA